MIKQLHPHYPHQLKGYESVPTGPWRFFNLAILHMSSIADMFNLMRYDNAFLIRQSDVNNMLRAATENCHHIGRFSILLCKVSDKGVTRPGWTYQMLTSTQEIEEISDAMALMSLGEGFEEFRPRSPLKFVTSADFTGDLATILNVMLDNRAIPATEGCAHKIEQAFFAPQDPFTVKLRFFSSNASPHWLLAEKPS